MSGWFKSHRELFDKPIWVTSTPEQKVILMTLLSMANYEPKEWEWKGQRYKVQPGQFITSLPSIAEKSGKGVSIQNVRTALKRFEKYEFLTDESTKQNRLITIVNWSIYQGLEKPTEEIQQLNQQTANSQLTDDQQTANSQLTASKNLRTKELKKDKELKKEELITKDIVQRAELFESWWSLYGIKVGKKKCESVFMKHLKEYGFEKIMDGTKRYFDYRIALDNAKLFVPQQKNPLTFLNGEHFNDEYENIIPTKGNGMNGPVRKNEAAFARTLGADGEPVRYGLPNQ